MVLKRIFAFCLLFALSLTVVGIMPVSAASDSEVQLLADLGIIDISEPAGLIPKGYTRGDFAAALNKMDKSTPVNFEAESGKTAYAADIEGNKNYNYIAAVIAAGYMETDGEKNFKPNGAITEGDAVKALVRALGYDAVAKQEGGTAASYLALGHSLGISKGVNIADTEKLTALEAAELLANSMSIRFFSEGPVDFGNMCFYDKWDLEKFRGRIYANSRLGLAVDRAPHKRVNIGGKLYYTELLIADGLVGSYVEYYVAEGDFGKEVVSICGTKPNDNLTLEAGDITGVLEKGNSIQIIYGDGEEEILIEKKAYAIVNGKTMSPTKELFDVFESGTVTFVDSDRDGSYDIAHMTLLVQSVLEGISVHDEVAVIRFDNQRLELRDVDQYAVYLNNKAASLSQLAPGMVVGIACDSFTVSEGAVTYDYSKAGLIALYASKRSAAGIVEEISEDSVLVDGMKRPLGAGYYRLVSDGYLNRLAPEDYVTLYLDIFSEVVYYEIDSAKSALKYGYVIAADLPSKAFGRQLRMRIMDEKGAINTYETNETFILDGVKVEANSLAYSVGLESVDLRRRQVVKFKAADGILRELDTQAVRTENGIESRENSLSGDLPFDPYAEGGAKREIIRNVVDYRYALKSDCIVFFDEAPLYEKNPSDHNFSVMKANNLGERYIAGYDADNNNLIGVLCVWAAYGMTEGGFSQKGLHGEAHGMVVEKITKSVDEKGENGYHIYLAGGDTKASYFAREGGFKLYETQSDADWGGGSDDYTVHYVDSSKLEETIKSGDVVRIELNLAQEITYIEKIFNFAEWKDTYKEIPFTTGGQVYGFTKLEKVKDKYLIYSPGNPDDQQKYIVAQNPFLKTVAVYYVNSKKTKIVSPDALPTAANGNNVKLFMRYYDYGWVKDTIAYVYDS